MAEFHTLALLICANYNKLSLFGNATDLNNNSLTDWNIRANLGWNSVSKIIWPWCIH